MDTLKNAATFISLLLGLVSLVSGIILWVRSSSIKRYAAERDFAHLQKNYESLSQHYQFIDSQLEEIRAILVECKVILQMKSK
jgi:hypothetical protein